MSKRTLLLADDSVTIQKVVNLTFADEGIDVVTVGDGDSAMQKISEISPDLILADVHMPGLSGYQICEIIRENPVTKDLPVVLLVGSFEPFDEGEAARVGANAYLTKPFQSIRQLVLQVTDLMDASRRSPEPVIAENAPVDESSFAEAQSEEDTVNEGPETNDIESLYHQSVSDLGTAEAESAAPRYVDAGMDDEMIETSFAEREEELFSDPVPDPEPEPEPEAEPYLAMSNDAPYGDSSSTAEFPVLSEPLTETTPFESFADDQHEGAAVAAATSEVSSEFDEFSRTEQIPELDIPSTQREFGLDEIELLELPPIEHGKTLEFTTTQRSLAEIGGKQVVSLSPELMDIIVQKVVEKLSEKY